MEFEEINGFSGDVISRLEEINDELVTLAYTIDEVKTITNIEIESLQMELDKLTDTIESGCAENMCDVIDDIYYTSNNLKSEIQILSSKFNKMAKKIYSLYASTFDSVSASTLTVNDDEIVKICESEHFMKNVKEIVVDVLDKLKLIKIVK